MSSNNSKNSVRQWSEVVYGNTFGLSMAYLADNSVPWSSTAFEMVFRLQKDVIPTIDERSEIIGEIAAIFKRGQHTYYGVTTPLVHFKGANADINIRDKALLELLWKEAPIIKGKKMTLVSKGFPENDITVYSIWGMPAEERHALVNSISYGSGDQIAVIIADLYQLDEVDGQPIHNGQQIFGGNMRILGKPGFGSQTTFLGEKFEKVAYPQVD